VSELFDPQLGDSSAGFAVRQGGNPGLRVFIVAWTEGPVSASVTVNGFTGVSVGQTVALARRQDRRIVQASS
jgi:hypothetical protein